MAPTKKQAQKPAENVFEFSAGKRGRKPGPSEKKVKAFTVLDSLFANNAKWISVKRDENGPAVKVLPVKPEDIDRPATYTGLRGLILEWAKDRGHSVTVPDNKAVPNGVGIIRKA